jgi:class 3 adenylate cyclase
MDGSQRERHRFSDTAGTIQPMGVTLPTGTVTFVFSDMAGSTALLKQLGDTEYGHLLAVHRRLVREIFAAHEGQEIDTQGDAFFYSFVRARQAVSAAIEVTRAHAKGTWPGGVEVRIRLGLHTGEPAVGDEGYTGLDVVRASRIAATGAGGQVLLSDTTRAIVAGDLGEGVEIRPLGERRLKDIDLPEPIFELVIDEVAAAPSPAAQDPQPEPEPSESAQGSQFARRTRELIESRVLSQLEKTFGEGYLAPNATPGPPRPPARSGRAMTKEIARLKELHEDGALTDEQYERAVDRLLEGDST